MSRSRGASPAPSATYSTSAAVPAPAALAGAPLPPLEGTAELVPLVVPDYRDAVVSLHELTGRTKGSGIPMTMQIGAVVSEFADGRIGAQRLFPSWESALEAAGLSE